MQNLSIIIATYNSEAIIKSCLESLNLKKYQVFVVDNASVDETLKVVAENFPEVEIIKNEKNIGYGRANNKALEKSDKDFALLLNADARISENDIEKIINFLEEKPDFALAGPIIYNCKIIDGEIIDEKICTKPNKKDKNAATRNYFENQFITGAGMFLNMKIIRKIGFFDEGFFLYCEDNEICKRVVKKGFKTAILKDAKLYHVGGNSSKISAKERERIYWHRFGWSKLYYTQKIYNVFIAKLKAIRMILKYSIICTKELIKNQKPAIHNLKALQGCVAYFIGIKAFDENDNARG
jgi:GT2 family glycosyltransferase